MSAAADFYGPYNGLDAYEGDWRTNIFGPWLADGVIAGLDNELLVYGDSSGRNVKVKSGAARALGTSARWNSEKTITLAANASGDPRIDRIVVRISLTAGLLTGAVLDVKAGTPAGSPVAPALTQSATVWELALAQVACANGFTTVSADKVTPERALLSLYTEPAFDSVAARDLWVPSPRVGSRALLRDTGADFLYTEGAWRQQRRQEFSIAFTPSGSESSGTNATWPTGLHTDIAVPEWATRCHMRALISQVRAINVSPCNVEVKLLLGAIEAHSKRIRWQGDRTVSSALTTVSTADATNAGTTQTLANALKVYTQAVFDELDDMNDAIDVSTVGIGAEQDLTLEGDLDCSSVAGTTITARTLADNVTVGGVLRVDDESSCFLWGEFR